jgi:tetratricopeptide (TPR) repeat protein
MFVTGCLGVVHRGKVLLIKALMQICPALLIGALACQSMSAQEAHRSDNLAELFRAAQQDSAAGRYEQAAKEYVQVLQIDPSLIEARFNLALAYHSLGRYKLAIAELEKVVRAQPTLVGADLFLGIDYLKEKRSPEAVVPLQKVLQVEPSNRDARHALAACYVTTEQYAQAAEEYRELAASDPDQADALYELGQNYLGLASHLAARMSQAEPDSAWARRLAGDLLAVSARWTDAAVNYRKALAADSRQPGLHTSLGNVCLRQGKVTQAKEEFQTELALDANEQDAWLGLAEAELASSEPQKALESLSRVVEIYPPFLSQDSDFPLVELSPESAAQAITAVQTAPAMPGRHFLLAKLNQIAGDESKAQEQWQLWQNDSARGSANRSGAGADMGDCRLHRVDRCVEYLQSHPHLDSGDQMLLGEALFSLGRYTDGANRLAQVLSTNKKNLQAAYWLARANMKLADTSLSELMQRFPDSWRAHEFAGVSDELRDRDDDAIREFQLAAKAHPNDPELHQRLGKLFYAKKSFAQAEEELRKAIELDPGHARSLYLLGRVYLERRETGQSIPYLQAALQHDPDLLEAHAALGQAYVHSEQPALAVKELQKAASTDKYGDLHYLLYVAYHKLGREDMARQALARSQELRTHAAALREARVSEASEEERRK